METEFKYDIAFSFLKKDQDLITKLFNLLKDKLDCFVYFNEQEKLAGRNGENIFNDVFAKESRMVVVAYDEDWGNTNWTRVEETAIRNRGHDEGYDFVTLMPIKSGVAAPKWLPKNRIWLGLKHYGLDTAAAVLESRVLELFGEIKQLSAEDKIIKEAELMQLREKNKTTINSISGVELAIKEFQNFKTILNEKIETLKEKLPDWHLKIIDNCEKEQNIMSNSHTLFYTWAQQHRNTGENTGVKIAIWNGYFTRDLRKTDPFWDYRKIKMENYFIDLDDFGKSVWKLENRNGVTSNSHELADKCLLEFFDHLKEFKSK